MFIIYFLVKETLVEGWENETQNGGGGANKGHMVKLAVTQSN